MRRCARTVLVSLALLLSGFALGTFTLAVVQGAEAVKGDERPLPNAGTKVLPPRNAVEAEPGHRPGTRHQSDLSLDYSAAPISALIEE